MVDSEDAARRDAQRRWRQARDRDIKWLETRINAKTDPTVQRLIAALRQAKAPEDLA